MADVPDLDRATVFSDFTRFRAFWRETEKVKSDVIKGILDGPTARAGLLAILREQETEVARVSDASVVERYRQAQYVMAAVADDAFVRIQWSGAEGWTMSPLETELFGSRCAGQLVFDRIDRLIAGTDPDGRPLAEVYLTALALGFEGKYAGLPHGKKQIALYRRRLRTFVFGDRESLSGPLVPQCYQSTMAVGPGRRLPSSRVWWWAAAAVLGIWLIVSSLLWRGLGARAVAGIERPQVTLVGAAR
jgi:type VI secretion system protein ImpK